MMTSATELERSKLSISCLPTISTSPSSFLSKLPAEIRNVVYYLLLTSEYIPALRRLVAQNYCSIYVLPPLPLYSALLSTCKQIYNEASPILYSNNTFTASPTLLTSLPYFIDPRRPICCPGIAKKIKRWCIKVRIDCDPRFTENDVTEAFTGAEELEVEAMQAMFQAANNDVLLLFKGVRAVGYAKVGGSVIDPFARWLEDSMMAPIGTDVVPYHDGIDTTRVSSGVQAYDPWLQGNR